MAQKLAAEIVAAAKKKVLLLKKDRYAQNG